jgi:hypothetical protein
VDEKWLELWQEVLDDLRSAEPRNVDNLLVHSIAHHLHIIKVSAEMYRKTRHDNEPLIDDEMLVDTAIANVDAILQLTWAFLEEPTESI